MAYRFNWDFLPWAEDEILRLAGFCGVHPLVARFLINRGISTETEAGNFFSPTLEGLSDSDKALPDVKKGAHRVLKAIKSKEPIFLFGDSDIDGISSTAILYESLKSLGARVSASISDRISDGYGLPNRLLEKFQKLKAGLVILLDCGTNQALQVEQFKKCGIDVIVIDHHIPLENCARAYALINPRLFNLNTQSHQLCTASIVFKFVWSLGVLDEGHIARFLDLAALGVLGDYVPLLSDNRVIVKLGINRLAESPRPGIRALIDSIGFGKLSAGNILRKLIPCLNSAGRLGKGNIVFRLLVSSGAKEARKLAEELAACHQETKSMSKEVTAQAHSQISRMSFSDQLVMVIGRRGWPSGLMGPLAAQIAQCYSRPAFAIAFDGEVGTGSGRSVGSFDMVEALKSCHDMLLKYGGHPRACGLTMNSQNMESFKQRLNAHARRTLTKENLIPKIVIEAEIALSDISLEWVGAIPYFEPFGVGNPKPAVLFRKIKIEIDKQGSCFASNGEACYKLKRKLPGLDCQETYDLVANPGISNGKIELAVCDIRISSGKHQKQVSACEEPVSALS